MGQAYEYQKNYNPLFEKTLKQINYRKVYMA